MQDDLDEMHEQWDRFKREVRFALMRDWARLKRASPLAAVLAFWFYMAGLALGLAIH